MNCFDTRVKDIAKTYILTKGKFKATHLSDFLIDNKYFSKQISVSSRRLGALLSKYKKDGRYVFKRDKNGYYTLNPRCLYEFRD